MGGCEMAGGENDGIHKDEVGRGCSQSEEMSGKRRESLGEHGEPSRPWWLSRTECAAQERVEIRRVVVVVVVLLASVYFIRARYPSYR